MPATSPEQATAAKIALAIKRGKQSPKKGTASANMANSMTKTQLKHFTHTEESAMPMLSDMAKNMMEVGKSTKLTLNGKEVDKKSIELDGVNPRDYPDFSDAYISSAQYVDGTPLSNEEIEQLENENYGISNDLAHGNYLQENDWRDDAK